MKKVTIVDIKQKGRELRLKLDYMDRTYHGVRLIPEGVSSKDMKLIKKDFVKEFSEYVDGSCQLESDKP